MQLAPGLHRVGNDVVACYLVVTDQGITLVDAALPGHWKDLERELAVLGRPLTDIRGIVLTHGDSDHIGFAERLRRQQGIPVFAGRADVARARGEEKTSPTWGRIRLLPTMRFVAYASAKGGLRTHYLNEVVAVDDGDVLDLPGSPRVMALPGHSPGSIAIVVPGVDAVFVGDGLTTRHVLTGATGPAPAPFTDDPALALESLDRLAGVGVRWVLPGHGAPWDGGAAEAVRRVRS
ncbi:MBL fold metallo-hydrolase [Cellulomonas sp. URHE0023]|uniref:MBL fold metallo-hydrolase n=1 Tax=Cellulomonas sp. URHE0023 TaxID=1380354 RepID=UPI000482F56B|nr:MBL fold metallo-hydrolase [Cellulomonas sp. URHE0023]